METLLADVASPVELFRHIGSNDVLILAASAALYAAHAIFNLLERVLDRRSGKLVRLMFEISRWGSVTILFGIALSHFAHYEYAKWHEIERASLITDWSTGDIYSQSIIWNSSG